MKPERGVRRKGIREPGLIFDIYLGCAGAPQHHPQQEPVHHLARDGQDRARMSVQAFSRSPPQFCGGLLQGDRNGLVDAGRANNPR
jgi:hypothetical protein